MQGKAILLLDLLMKYFNFKFDCKFLKLLQGIIPLTIIHAFHFLPFLNGLFNFNQSFELLVYFYLVTLIYAYSFVCSVC